MAPTEEFNKKLLKGREGMRKNVAAAFLETVA
jgi:hypothetical protein